MKQKLLLRILCVAVICLCCQTISASRTFHAVESISELKDGDLVVLVSNDKYYTDCKIAMSNTFYDTGNSIINGVEASFLDTGTLTVDDDSAVAVFNIRKGEPANGHDTFAFQTVFVLGGTGGTEVSGWLKAGSEKDGVQYLNYQTSESPDSDCYAEVYMTSSYGIWIRYYVGTVSYNICSVGRSFGEFKGAFNLAKGLSNAANSCTYFTIYVADQVQEPQQTVARFTEPKHEITAGESINLSALVECNSDATPDVYMTDYFNNDVDPSKYNVSVDSDGVVLTVDETGMYKVILEYPANERFTEGRAETVLSVVDKDYTLRFTIDGVPVTDESVNDIPVGAIIGIECASPSAEIYYIDEFMADYERPYTHTFELRSGRSRFSARAVFNDVERATAVLVARTADEDPEASSLSFADDSHGMTPGLTGDDYEPNALVYTNGNIRFYASEDECIRLAEGSDGDNVLEIASGSGFDVTAIENGTRLTSLNVIADGEVTLGVYSIIYDAVEEARYGKRRLSTDSTTKVGEICGSGNLNWDYDGEKDLSTLIVRNESQDAAFVKSIEATKARQTVTRTDTITVDNGHDYEYFTPAGIRLTDPSGAGIVICRDRATGKTKLIVM